MLKMFAEISTLNSASPSDLKLSVPVITSRTFKASREIQYSFNGSNSFGTMMMCLRQGKFDLMCVNIAPGQRHNRDIFSIFFDTKICCVFSLESPRRF